MKANNTGINYSTSTRNVQLLIDEGFAEKVIPADDSVRLLDQIIEEMDLSALYRAVSDTHLDVYKRQALSGFTGCKGRVGGAASQM